jgi:sulfur-oxidizing protein SoxY
MDFTRRDALILGAGAATVALLPVQAFASGDSEAIAAFTGGAATSEGGIDLTAPEIAENGNTVPVAVSAPGAVSIILLAAGNPNPDVCTFNFSPLSGSQSASTRIRLAGTQEVIAIAKMADGSFVQTSSIVKVTIGGCGG